MPLGPAHVDRAALAVGGVGAAGRGRVGEGVGERGGVGQLGGGQGGAGEQGEDGGEDLNKES